MKKLLNGFVVAGLISFLGVSSASAAMMGMVRPELVGGINDMTTSGGALGFTAGLDLDFWLTPMMDMSVGGQYLSRAFTGGSSNINYVQIPAIVRLHLGPVIRIGGGGFYDLAVTSGAAANYGLTGSLRLKPMLFPLFLEGRFNYGLNSSSTGWGTNTSEVQVLLGFIL